MYFGDLKQKSMSSKEWIRLINENSYTPQEIAYIYCCVLTWEDENLTDPENLLSLTEAFLARGMNPNEVVFDEDPYFDDYPDERGFPSMPLVAVSHYYQDRSLCVEPLKCLFENGGHPNNAFPLEPGKSKAVMVVDHYYLDVWAHGPWPDECDFYGLLLCFAYGGAYDDGVKPFEMLIDAPETIFKDYNRYWYVYEVDSYDGPMYVIEKETGKRIAKWVR